MIDTTNCVTDVLYRLGFVDAADIAATGHYVTVDELYQWADEAAKTISYGAGLFVRLDSSITAIAATSLYNLPANHVFTLQAWLGSANLRITPQRELWALDATWPATSGPAQRASYDAGAPGTVTLYPNPTVGGTVSQLAQEFPAADIAIGAPTVALPTVLQDFFSYAMLAGARGKESDGAMPEMADHFSQRLALYQQIAQHLYGQGQ